MIDSLYRVEVGSGAPLLIMHGGLGWDHTYLRPWLDPLAENAHLTYYDHRGNGRSPEPDDWSSVTHATWVEDAEDLRSRVYDDRRVVLFGHSYGGILALEYALRHGWRLDGLVICCSGPNFKHAENAVERAYSRAATAPDPDRTRRALDALLAGPPKRDEIFADILAAIITIYVHQPDAIDLGTLIGEMRPRAAAARRSFYELLPNFDAAGRLGAIKVPTLVLSGRHDWAFPPEEGARALMDGLTEATSHVFEKSGHLPFLEEPAVFTHVLTEWLGELPRARFEQ